MSNKGVTCTDIVSTTVIVGDGKKMLCVKQGDVHLKGQGGRAWDSLSKQVTKYKVQIKESMLML